MEVSVEYASTNNPQHRYVRARWESSCSYGVVHACRQRIIVKVSLGMIDVNGGVCGQQGAALRDRHAVPVQDVTMDGAGSATCLSHRRPGLRTHRDVL